MGNSSGLRDEDVERILSALNARSASGLHYFDMMVGGGIVLAMIALIYFRYRSTALRHLMRSRQAFAYDALKEADPKLLKEVLGKADVPSWMTMPDWQRVGFLNQIIDQLWPHVNQALCTMCRAELEPVLKDQKPSWISSISLSRFDLGDRPPQINGVKVYPKSSTPEEVDIELDFTWAGQQEVALVVKPIPKHLNVATVVTQVLSNIIMVKAGVQKLIMNGRLRVSFKPLLNSVPIIAAIQFALVEMPSFSFDITVYGGDATFLPGLEAWINSLIKDTVLRPYVLPERFTYPLVAGDLGQIDKPKAMLFVTVVKATNVPKMDFMSDSDPFVLLFVRDSRKVKTQVKDNSANPEWNEEFQFLVHEPDSQQLTAVLYDYDLLNENDEIGRVSIPVRDLTNGEELERWIEIKQPQKPKSDGGLVGAVTSAPGKGLDKVRSAAHKMHLGNHSNEPCQLLLRLSYFEFQHEELEALGIDSGQKAAPEEEPGQPDTEKQKAAVAAQIEQRKDRHAGDPDKPGEVPDPRKGSDNSQHGSKWYKGSKAYQNGEAGDGQASNGEQGGQEQEDGQGKGTGALLDDGKDGDHPGAGREGTEQQQEQRRKAEKRRRRVEHRDGRYSSHDLDSGQGPPEAEGDREGRQRPAPGMGGTNPGEGLRVKENRMQRGDSGRKKVMDALRGGVLYVRITKAVHLIHKPVYKGNFSGSQTTCKVMVGGEEKFTVAAKGKEPGWDDNLEFILGHSATSKPNIDIVIELWDYKFFNHFKGRYGVPLSEVIKSKQIKETVTLKDVRHGQLSFELAWLGIAESAR